MYQTNPHPTDPPRSPRETLPTMYDLPSEDPQEPGLPDEFHLFQPRLLDETFVPPNYPADQVFTATDLNLYYDLRHTQWYKRPDWFAAVGVSRLYDQRELRLSYVIWQEEVSPTMIVELLSPGTETEDLGQTLRDLNQPPSKWDVYERILRVPYYVVFDRYTDTLQAFRLGNDRYQAVDIASQAGLWLDEVQLGLGLWRGNYRGVERLWLRWFDAQGNWIPTPLEQATQQIEHERQRAEHERQRAERLAERLRELGIDPDTL